MEEREGRGKGEAGVSVGTVAPERVWPVPEKAAVEGDPEECFLRAASILEDVSGNQQRPTPSLTKTCAATFAPRTSSTFDPSRICSSQRQLALFLLIASLPAYENESRHRAYSVVLGNGRAFVDVNLGVCT